MTPDDIIDEVMTRSNNPHLVIKYIASRSMYEVIYYDCYQVKRQHIDAPAEPITVDVLTRLVNDFWTDYRRWLSGAIQSNVMYYIYARPIVYNEHSQFLPQRVG